MQKFASKQYLMLCYVIVAGFLAACCNTPTVANFEPSSHVSTRKQQFEVMLVTDSRDFRKGHTPWITREDDFQGIGKACGLVSPEEGKDETRTFSALAISMLATAGEFAFNRYYDEKNKELERLKKAASPPAFVIQRFLESGESLEKLKCLIVMTKEKHEGMLELKSVAALRLVRVGQGKPAAFYLQPAYLRFGNSVALARKLMVEDKEQPARIEVSFGLSIKSVGLEKTSGNSIVSAAGEGGVTVNDVAVGPEAVAMKCEDNSCPSSDLIPYPGKGPISLSVSMAEVGDVGFDIDDAIGLNKALAAAFGPVVKNAITDVTSGK